MSEKRNQKRNRLRSALKPEKGLSPRKQADWVRRRERSRRINKVGCQGDVMFMRTEKVPDGAELASEGRAIVAHSETGHHHVCESHGAQYFTVPSDPFTCYLRLAEDADVKHLRPYDTHETVTLPAGTWIVRRQREYTPEGYRMVQD